MLKTLLIILHILAATIWVGGHIVLSTVILPRALRDRDVDYLHDFESRYERIGIPSLLVSIITGVWLAWTWLPNVPAWFNFSTPISHFIFTKFFLLALTIGLAAHARLKLIPNLTAERLPALAAHIIAVTIISILFVLVGVFLRSGGL